MAHWPLPSQPVGVHFPSGLPVAVNVTGSATPHAKGAWTELEASIPPQVRGLWLYQNGTSQNGTDTRAAFDLAIGAAGSEIVIMEGVLAGYSGDLSRYFPFTLPEGARLSARAQGFQASKVIQLRPMFVVGDPGMLTARDMTSICKTYGFDPATSSGVQMAQPAAVNAYSPWVEIAAATTERCDALHVSGQLSSASTGAVTGIIEIGHGAAGQETPVVQVPYETTSGEQFIALFRAHVEGAMESKIPLGARLAGRIWATAQTTSARPWVAVHTFRR